MLIITQESWHADATGARLLSLAEAASLQFGDIGGSLLLLPLGEADWEQPRPERELLAEAGAASNFHGIYIAGAVPVLAAHSDEPQTVGFVVGPDGNTALRVPKITPDFIEGFTDSACELGRPADLPVLDTPLGRLGILTGEDILYSHYARVLTYNGAEVILNPCRERRDAGFESRLRARRTRAYESSAYVAVATPHAQLSGDVNVRLPCASALYLHDQQTVEEAGQGESFLKPDFSIEFLRRKRSTLFMNQPVYMRSMLYAPGYLQAAAADQAAAREMPQTRDGWSEEAGRRIAAQAQANRIDGPTEDQYSALLVQNEFRVIHMDTPNPEEILRQNLDEAIGLAARSAFIPNVRLVCFPEFFMTGSGGFGKRTPKTLERIAITYPGPETDVLSEFAQKNHVYVAGSTFEKDPRFPERVFNSAFILNDSGDLILHYRKLHCADIWGQLPDTTPGSIYSRLVEELGYDALFPVVDTPLGKLAAMVCFDHTVPETAHMLAKRGAEVIIHCTSDPHGAGRRPWEECRMTRAHDNGAYILAPRPGGEYFDPHAVHPGTFLRGYTRIIGYDGRLLGEADTSGKVSFQANLDLAELRRYRAKASANMLIWDEPRSYVDWYEQGHGLPGDLWAGDPQDNPYANFAAMKDSLERFYKEGIYLRPGSTRTGAETDARSLI
ncbi:MAG: hypothetical protein F4222_05180 [Gammaproteobacteria bacterium]|nr:hypothetical protein [Gammaproteobacteria bacterium]MYF58435.1 hypothetical protein [Gammaproteobacteria bacterium]